MDGGHEALLEAELIIDDLGDGGKAVGGAGGVRHDIGAVVLEVVDAHDVHGGVGGGGGDDDLLGSSLHVEGGLLDGSEDSGRLNDVVNIGVSPGDLGRVHFSEDCELLSSNGQSGVGVGNNLGGVLSMDGVVLEHVLHVVGGDEGVVDGDDVDHGVVLSGAHNEAADAAESVDSDVDGLGGLLGGLAVHDVSELGLEGGSSDKETVDVGLLTEAGGGGPGGGSSVKDAGLLGNGCSSDLAEVLPAVGVGLLGLLRGGGEAGADGPDGLVGDDDPLPVLRGEDVGIGLELGEDEVVGGSGLAVLLGLSAASDDGEALVEGVFGLGGAFLVGLALLPPLRVADDGPAEAHVSATTVASGSDDVLKADSAPLLPSLAQIEPHDVIQDAAGGFVSFLLLLFLVVFAHGIALLLPPGKGPWAFASRHLSLEVGHNLLDSRSGTHSDSPPPADVCRTFGVESRLGVGPPGNETIQPQNCGVYGADGAVCAPLSQLNVYHLLDVA
mmetsp:Transcript_2577/g.4651  ORF Transcript_2577/g.4651 Transcript_2577/m.4651 type:complete len:498 (-) Transcript_2577:2604-4097(-)